MNEAKKNLINGTLVYFIGNVLVALIQLILLRFITGNVSPDGYGYYNLIVTAGNLITPIITLQISDAVFYYVIRNNINEKKQALTCGIIVISSGIFFTIIVLFFLNDFFYKVQYMEWIILYIVSNNLFSFYQKMSRALGKNIEYVKVNLIKTVCYILLQIGLIKIFSMAEESLFISVVIANFICIFLLELSTNCRKYFSFKYFKIKFLIKMLKFSVPLIPNTILWWLSGSINSLIITGYLGLEANGIYNVAGRFANVISMVSSVFNLAWQESAIREYGSNESKSFYRETFNMYFKGIASCVIACIPSMFFLMPLMIDYQYQSALTYAPILVLSTGFSAMYGFFGQMYAATGKTVGAFTTTIYGVITNLVVLILFIKPFGLFAPCIALLLSSIAITFARYKQFKEEMSIKVPEKIVEIFTLLIVVLVFYYLANFIVNAFLAVIVILFMLVLNKDLINDIALILKNKMRGNKGK